MADIHNRLITEFVQEGERQNEAALKKFRARLSEARKETDEGREASLRWVKAVAGLDRDNVLADISRGLREATKDGRNFTEVLEAARSQLTALGATESEISGILRNAQQTGGGAAGLRGGSAAGQGGNRLQQIGRELRLQLPAVPIGGFSSEQGARVVEVFGRVQESFGNMERSGKLLATSLGAAAAGVVVLLTALSNLNETFARQTRAIIQGQEEFTRLRLTGTREELEAAQEARRVEIQIAQARVEENKRLLAAVQESAGPIGSALSDVFNIAGVQELRVETQKLEQQIETASFAESRLAGLRNDTAVATRLAAEAEAALLEETNQRQQRNALDRASVQIETERFVIEATHEQFEARKLFLEQEIYIIQRGREALQAMGLASEELDNRLTTAANQLAALTPELEAYTIAHDKAREAEQRRLDLAEEVRRFEEQRVKIEDESLQKRADLTAKFNQSMEDLARGAADAAQDALRKLQQRRDDLARDLSADTLEADIKRHQDRMDVLIDFQREETDLLEDHATKIKDIRARGLFDEQQAIQNRDAIALDAARSRTADAISEERRNLDKAQRQRNRAFQLELADLDRQFTRERQARLRKYERDSADLQLQHEREVEQNAINTERRIRDLDIQNRREILQLQRQTAQKLKLEQQAHAAELKLINQSAQARFEAEQRLIDEWFKLAQKRILQLDGVQRISGTGVRVPTMAGGGSLMAGHTAIVNELRREGFQTGGQSRLLPDGLGVFTPARSGQVQANPGGFAVTLNLAGMQRGQIMATSRQQAERVFSDILDEYERAG